jgi:hypothetical protein
VTGSNRHHLGTPRMRGERLLIYTTTVVEIKSAPYALIVHLPAAGTTGISVGSATVSV